MAYEVLSPESEQLTFICGLGWPEVSRYYLSQRRRGMWEFWEQSPGNRLARLVFVLMLEDSPAEIEVAKRMLDDFLGTFKASTQPRGETVQGLLSLKEIQRVLRRHDDRRESTLLRFPLRPGPTDSSAA